MPAGQPTAFLERILGFLGALRAAGLPADPAGAISLGEALTRIDIGRPADVQAAARALLVHRREHLGLFDEVFREYWLGQHRPGGNVPGEHASEVSGRSPTRLPQLAAGEESAGERERAGTGYSPDEVIARRDLATLGEGEIERARWLLREFIRAFAALRVKRYARARRGSIPDFRRLLRQAAVRGGDLATLPWRHRPRERTRLLVLCDVSGSMERYARFLLEFVYGLRRELPDTEVAVFATRMTVITDLLQTGAVTRSLREVAARAGDWGGGTDIGGCLRDFNDRYARDLVRYRTTVVLLSDGWDRGDAAVMAAEIARLRRRAHRLVWLNPLLGNPDYQPLTRGMSTALPYLDHFLPAHNLESLARLARVLADDRRGVATGVAPTAAAIGRGAKIGSRLASLLQGKPTPDQHP
ncbi:MAG: VWA domain-containing protein, partial [Gammaproteobacteria bacterium]|nr:VWA domain-containing protein [Gammaproteobacteria bacterium]